MEHEAQGDDLYPGLEAEHSDEVGLRLLLHTHQETESEPLASESEDLTTEASPWAGLGDSHQSLGHGRFVFSGKVLLQGQDDAVGDDGGEDHVLEQSGRLKLRDFRLIQRLTCSVF